jgi:hypothetical protein
VSATNKITWPAYKITETRSVNVPSYQGLACEDCDGNSGRWRTYNIADLIFDSPGRTYRVCQECAWVNHGVLVAPVYNEEVL